MTGSSMLDAMIAAARLAGESLSNDLNRPDLLEVREKAASDFVTSADLRSEAILRSALSAAFPDHVLVMEESDRVDAPNVAGRPRLLVDPLDGTTNFLHGIPHFAVAIARELDGDITAGVVLDVPKDELFWVERGRGAWVGDRRLSVSTKHDLTQAIVATGIPHHNRGDHPAYLAALERIMGRVAGIRRFGAATLDLAYVAAGRFASFFELDLAPWDVAAGALMVREAGGVVTDTRGGPMRPKDILASSGEDVHREMLESLRPLHRD